MLKLITGIDVFNRKGKCYEIQKFFGGGHVRGNGIGNVLMRKK